MIDINTLKVGDELIPTREFEFISVRERELGYVPYGPYIVERLCPLGQGHTFTVRTGPGCKVERIITILEYKKGFWRVVTQAEKDARDISARNKQRQWEIDGKMRQIALIQSDIDKLRAEME